MNVCGWVCYFARPDPGFLYVDGFATLLDLTLDFSMWMGLLLC
jgi:hypothetical protein